MISLSERPQQSLGRFSSQAERKEAETNLVRDAETAAQAAAVAAPVLHSRGIAAAALADVLDHGSHPRRVKGLVLWGRASFVVRRV